MIIQIDSREKPKAIKGILQTFKEHGIDVIESKLFVGDYMNFDNPRFVIDRKQNLTEVCQNVCQDHDRFRRELIRAQEHGIKVVILVEHGQGVESLPDVAFWQNPRIRQSPKAVNGERLYKILLTIQKKYDCRFEFCDKSETGERIIKMLGGDE